MKLLSMNVHGLIEAGYETKLRQFADMVLAEQPDIIGLQEVDQTRGAPVVEDRGDTLEGYVPCGKKGEDRSFVPVLQDNYGLQLSMRLKELGIPYHWTWIPVKVGYGRYDEGLALFSKAPILDTDRFFISRSQDPENWKTREILGIQLQAEGQEPFWSYTVHMGWWDDKEEPFKAQWEQVQKGLAPKLAQAREKDRPLWLMGDFNSPAQVRGEGYDLIGGWGWEDTYDLAEKKDEGITVEGEIDGWRDKAKKDGAGATSIPGMRIDHIWCSKKVGIKRSEVVCDGRRYPKVSDHNGVMVTLG